MDDHNEADEMAETIEEALFSYDGIMDTQAMEKPSFGGEINENVPTAAV